MVLKLVRNLLIVGALFGLLTIGPLLWRVMTVTQSQLASNRRLVNAILHKDTVEVNAALKAGANPNAEMEGWHWTDSVHPLANALTGDIKKHLRDTPLLLVMDCLVKRDPKAVRGKGIPLENLETVKALVESGADINAENCIGDTALSMAVSWGYDNTAEYLLSHKANPNIPNDGGDTPLSDAASDGNTKLVTDLLAHGANPNNRDICGRTPLMWAAVPPETPQHVETVRLLLQHGADASLKDEAGLTVLSLALHDNRAGIAKLLQQHGAK